ncbi:EAL domain-containing protein [Aquitalea sp. LB_tupeE]|uniref:EAL domain-containing response regulator n=1 Tax=Aquitalea sp. LB_tupeE TaxID=2748078 RepID=UPI0015BCBADB|nr:EAL domain-containing protein [Aquitalea sp. LB_tupeE]NWK78876.1 EAL domain-containing protein [Aquitalea sp. LB_tupeE]
MSGLLNGVRHRPLQVLVAEDHPAQRQVLVSMLEQHGECMVDEVGDGFQALSLLKTNKYDLMICDIGMPELDGIQLMRHLGQLDHLPQLIFCSAHSEDILHSVQRFGSHHHLPVLACLEKPFSADQLSTLLQQCVQQRSDNTVSAGLDSMVFSRQELEEAMQDGQIQPWYQPKIDPQTLEVLSVEALARWDHPVYGVLTPGVFLPQLDMLNLSEELLCSILQQAARDCCAWDIKFPQKRLGVAVNINVREFDKPDMPEKLNAIVQSMHLSPSRITLELTETQPLNNLSLSLENAIRLRVMGFNLALDDFGVGYSGFHHLREIPANSVKIDRLLVHQAAGDPAAEKLLGFAVRMLQSQNVSVVVEGVSRRQDFELVKQLQVDLVQGFLLAEPMSRSRLDAFIMSPVCSVNLEAA